ncbi:MAG: branched-chain amino acid ABC transporter permease [Anaerolineaceae bacterium]|nr:branched-chain amino acid ABC transporter permease [Anaerolineaceae bacterium]
MFLQQLVNGLVIGAVYALAALGYSMVYGMVRMMNFAHGDILMFGTYLTLTFTLVGFPFYIALPLGVVAGMAVALVVARFAYMPLLDRPRNALVLTSVGASLLLENVAQLFWGASVRPFPKPSIFSNQTHAIGGAMISDFQIIILAVLLVSMAILTIFVRYTRLGIAMRATSSNMLASRLMGIPARFIVFVTFAIGSVMAVLGGVLIGIYYNSVWPTMGFSIGLAAFSASILGGIGSLPGAVLGGLFIGVAESLGASYISSGFRGGVAFIVLILILLVRPSGILGQPEIENI